jgi:hypothetical protein
MKHTKWASLLSAAIFPFYSGCAQPTQNRYPTSVVQSGPAYQEPLAAGPDAGQPAPPPDGATYDAPPADAPPSAGAPANISPAAAEMIKMAESGVTEDVLVAYAQKSPTRYDLTADTILYLKDLGLTSTVITAMVNRDGSLRSNSQAEAPAPQYQSPPPAAQPGPPPGQPEAPAPAVQAAQPAYVSNPPEDVNYFYDNLSPYGTWVVLDGVGWCWQPRAVVVDRGWSPYCNSGHWVFTDCGWFWQSDYSWGWAPFHYGRWYRHDRCGWVWTPDRVWGPAWVTWRESGDTCGWAPLPPHAEFDVHLGWRFNGVRVGATFDFGLRPDNFTFVAVHDFNRHDFARTRLPITQVRNVYNHTTIINNTPVVNNTIVNRGIPADRVAAATHTQVRKVAIKQETASAARMPHNAGSARGGTVYREQLKAPSRPARVVAQKIDNNHPVVQHNELRTMARNQSFNAAGQRSSSPAAQSRTLPNSRNSQSLQNSSVLRHGSRSAQTELPAGTSANQRQNVPTVTPSPYSAGRGGRESVQANPDRVQQPNPALRQREQNPAPAHNNGSFLSEGRSRSEAREAVPRQSQTFRDNEVPRQYSPKGAQEPRVRSEPQVERRSAESFSRPSSESRGESRSESRGDNRKDRN